MNAITVIKNLLAAMEMQERREAGEYHMTQPTAKLIWDKAKADANHYLSPEIFGDN